MKSRCLILFVATSLLGCEDDAVAPKQEVSPDVHVRFTTFVNNNFSVPVDEMDLLLITSLDEANAFTASLRFVDPALEHLSGVDYAASVVAVLSGGWRGNNRYFLTVNRIVRSSEQVTIHALFSGSPAGYRVISYPVQVFAMPRTHLPIALSITYECDGHEVGPNEACFRFPHTESEFWQ